MIVRKKSGVKEDFDISKIRRSIANAASDCGMMMTESDLSNACKMIEKVIIADGNHETSSYELFGAIVFKLNELDYKEVVQSYIKGALGITK